MLRSIGHMSRRAIPGALALATAAMAGGCEKKQEMVWPAAITVTPGTAILEDITLTVQLEATVEDENGQVMQDAQIRWLSSFDSVARVNGRGLVTALDSGRVTVWAFSGRLVDSANITVAYGPRAYLGKLFDATGGPDSAWTAFDNWGTSKPLDEWYGVETDAEGNVTGLRLTDNGLNGVLPPEIGKLTHLEQLILNGNGNLGGRIPPEIGELANLKSLHISASGFVGRIPREIGSLVNLESFLVRQEGLITPGKLSGPIPPEFGNLGKLEVVDISNNFISGSLPPELGNLASLRQFTIDTNGLEGPIPPEFGNLGNLAALVINNNPLSGSLPGELTAVPLSTFLWQATDLCAPTDAAFQEWLQSINNNNGSGDCDEN